MAPVKGSAEPLPEPVYLILLLPGRVDRKDHMGSNPMQPGVTPGLSSIFMDRYNLRKVLFTAVIIFIIYFM